MANLDDLKNLEVYCKNSACGDPVADRNGKIHYTKRRMNYLGTNEFLGRATYACPICGKKQNFIINPLNNSIREA